MRTPPSVFSPKRNNMKQPSPLFVLVQLTPPARPHLPRTSRSSSFERGPGEHPGMDSGSVKMFIEHLLFQNQRFPEISQSSSQESLLQITPSNSEISRDVPIRRSNHHPRNHATMTSNLKNIFARETKNWGRSDDHGNTFFNIF